MQFITLNSINLHFQVTGLGDGKPVLVFINSLGTDFRIWREVVAELADQFGIVTYDKRGHGLSDLGAPPYAMADHASDLAALLDHLGVENVIVCGLSIGGQIAQQLYADRPDLVSALIFCDTAAQIGDPEFWRQRIGNIEANGLEAVADGILERWFTPQFRDHSNVSFPGYRTMLVRQPVAGYVGSCAAIAAFDMRDKAGQIAVPVLCVVGDQDGATPPEMVENFAKSIPGARFAIIAGAGHIPCVEAPEQLSSLIRDFSARILREQ